MNNKLLYTTRELFDSYLQNGKWFSIPYYQRGYKWESKDIERLLKDIDEFCPNEDLDLFYCLQNITLVEKQDNFFNVVDGQQRLTTLAVILSYLDEHQLINGKLRYNVRLETGEFLNEYIFKQSPLSEIPDWSSLLEICNKKGKDYDFQDIYYIFNAYKTIQYWFNSNQQKKVVMKDKILNHLKVIVNLPKNIDEQELFENLNGKRVPLDGADLIRAIIITRVAKKEIGELNDTIKQNVLINEKRVKIGLTLDTFNLWWSDDNKKQYFRHFTKEAKVSDASSIAFDEVSFPINNLYKIYCLTYNDGKLSMDFFERKSTEDGFLQELQMLQRTLENWYNDRELYHIILFTAIFAGDANKELNLRKLSFKELYDQWTKSRRKKFIIDLKNRIKSTEVFVGLMRQVDCSDEENERNAFSESWYDERLVNISTMLDIISILSSKGDNRLPARHFKSYKEDLEHIFPQTPIGDRIKDKEKQTQILKQYIDIINESLPESDRFTVEDSEIDWDNQEWKDKIKTSINDKIGEIIPINSLGNMCVLHESVNRGYGNDFFLEKRIDIMRKSQDGFYIRPHVYDAFNKIYVERQDESINMSIMTRWDKSDILARRKYIISKISYYLTKPDEQA